ncbi:hypothetical protein A2U01_0050235, partial [Trifolium medium]|nr:hypothetical protein [Trifolium medium]
AKSLEELEAFSYTLGKTMPQNACQHGQRVQDSWRKVNEVEGETFGLSPKARPITPYP